MEHVPIPEDCAHLRGWIMSLMLEDITPPTAFRTIKSWAANEEAKNILLSIPEV